ncbi:DNA-binding protein [Azospirillum sp. TSH58]|uniref:DNA-binding protein n=1 Tax=Azospirillum sp. TSH58 TaxID=664962 RepID=UPI0011B298DB|nr:DNA-binding protein [Azospirillum sp. TSH58]
MSSQKSDPTLYAVIRTAVITLVSRKISPTYDDVRAQIGGGSYRDIGREIRALKAQEPDLFVVDEPTTSPADVEPPESGSEVRNRTAEAHFRQAVEQALKAFFIATEAARSEERRSSAQRQPLALEGVQRSLAASQERQNGLTMRLATAEKEYEKLLADFDTAVEEQERLRIELADSEAKILALEEAVEDGRRREAEAQTERQEMRRQLEQFTAERHESLLEQIRADVAARAHFDQALQDTREEMARLQEQVEVLKTSVAPSAQSSPRPAARKMLPADQPGLGLAEAAVSGGA